MLYIIVNVNKNNDKNFVDYIVWMKTKIEIYNIIFNEIRDSLLSCKIPKMISLIYEIKISKTKNYTGNHQNFFRISLKITLVIYDKRAI